ncbi:MAG: DUF5018 domain-containing protein [Candidatus Magasanikbacteria bacterium]|nr:DUF5018 domain-containing protein [Candidatus Magasanikbacteria bacterium]
MENNNAVPLIIVVVIVAIIAVAGMWWYFAQQSMIGNSAIPNQTQNQNQVATKSSQKNITAFSFLGLNPPVAATIDNTAHTVTLTVPKNTDLKTLSPTVVVSNKATVSPTGGVAQDFGSPVIYTVTAEDGSTQSYVVKVNVAP